jgi:hypothetical protein
VNHFVIIENAQPYLSYYDDEHKAMAEQVLAAYACEACKVQHARGVATPKCCRIEQSDLEWSEFRRPRMVAVEDDDEEEDDEE